MIFGSAHVLNSARFDLFSFPRGLIEGNRCVHGKFSFRLIFPLTRLTVAEIGDVLEKKFAASIFNCLD